MNIRPLRWASIANSAQLLFVAATTAVNCSNETTSPIHALLRLLCGYNGNAFSACSFATTFLFWSGDYAECMNGGVSLFAAALAAGAFAAAMLRSVSVAFSHWQ